MNLLVRESKGQSLEKRFSKKIHSFLNKNLVSVILVDPKFLRSFDCGQIDLCTIEKYSYTYCLKIYEVKSQPAISKIQMSRLRNSANLLSEIFNQSAIIEILYPDF